MTEMVTGMRSATRGAVVALALLAGPVPAAPIYAALDAPPAPGPSHHAMPVDPASALAGRPAADARWSAGAWRYRPVAPGANLPPAPAFPPPWAAPAVLGQAPAVPAPAPAPAAFGERGVAFPTAPTFARQYAWRPLSPAETAAARWPPAMVAGPDDRDYRFRPMPPPGFPRYAAYPRWSAPSVAWRTHGPVPPVALSSTGVPAPWVTQGAHWPLRPSPASAGWRPTPAPFAGQAYRFRPDGRLGPAAVQLAPAADLAWTPGEGGYERLVEPWARWQQPNVGAPAWVRAYN